MSLFKRKPKPVALKSKSSFEKRKWIGVFLIIASLLIAFVVIPMVNGTKTETVSIAVAKVDIQKGTPIAKEEVDFLERGTFGLKGYITDDKAVIGKPAAVDIMKDDSITVNKIGNENISRVQSIINEKKTLATISIKTNAAGLASHLKSGDKVRLYNIVDDGYGGIAVNQNPLLDKVEVYDVENSNTQSIESDNTGTMAGGNEMIVSTVTLITVSREQERALIEAEYQGSLHVVFIER